MVNLFNKFKSNRILRVISLSILFVALFIFILSYKLLVVDAPTYENISSDNVIFERPKSFNNNLKSIAWIPNWASESGLSSLKKNYKDIDSISPVLFDMAADGSLTVLRYKNLEETVKFAKSKNIEIIPTIAQFDHEIFTSVLQSEENTNRHIDEIMKVLENSDYAGIDIDYESTKLSDRENYNKFIVELSSRIKAKNKKLVITVLSKWGDQVEYRSLKETRKVQDWAFLSNYADQIRIMAYDFTYSKSKYPGPISPKIWFEQIIKYARTKIPDDKIVMGVHLYSYQWSTFADKKEDLNNMQFNFITIYENNPRDENVQINSFENEQVSNILKYNKGKTMSFEDEQVFIYQIFDSSKNMYANKVLVYPSREMVLSRKQLSAEYGIFGVAFWKIGANGDLVKE